MIIWMDDGENDEVYELWWIMMMIVGDKYNDDECDYNDWFWIWMMMNVMIMNCCDCYECK